MPEAGLSKRLTERMLQELLRALAAQPARALDENFALIEKQTVSLAREHERLFADLASEASGIPAEFARAPNGSLYQTNLTDGSSFFAPAASADAMGEEEWMFARKSVALNPLYRTIVEQTPNVVAAYINTDEPVDTNRYFPFIERPWEVFPPEIDMGQFNFFYEADAAHNPGRKPCWTGIYADPAGRGWMLSCVAPVYRGDDLKGVVGLDVTVGEVLDSIVKLSLPWGASSLLIAPDGDVLAATEKARALLGLGELEPFIYNEPVATEQTNPEVLRIDSVGDVKLRAELLDFLRSGDDLRELPAPDGSVFIAQSVVPTNGWKFWLVVRRADLLEEVEELGKAESKLQAELSAKERELAYTRGLYESASGYLHNVGNAITRMESSLMDLDKVIKSSEQYPEAFRRIREGGAAGEETLRRFEEVLVGKTAPALKEVSAAITRTKDAIRNAITSQQAGFKAAVRQAAEPVQLSELLGNMCALFRKDHPALAGEIAEGVIVRSHREPLAQGLDNVIRNAVQASAPGGAIQLTCAATPGGAVVTVTDHGKGIAREDLPKVMSAGFTTKESGHGLGLHSFAVFLSASGGRLMVESEGPGRGTRVTVEIRNA